MATGSGWTLAFAASDAPDPWSVAPGGQAPRRAIHVHFTVGRSRPGSRRAASRNALRTPDTGKTTPQGERPGHLNTTTTPAKGIVGALPPTILA